MNLATVLKQEISRLARKEARALQDKVHRASAQHRRDIASLKRQVSALEGKVSLLEKKAWTQSRAKAGAAGASESVRFSARGLASQRARLGFSAAEYSALVDVTAQTLYNWENGQSRPRENQLIKLAELRGISKKEALARLDHSA